MKKKWFQRVLCLILSVTVLLTSMGFTVSAASQKHDPTEKNPYKPTTLEEMQSLVGTLPYGEYIANILEQNIPAGSGIDPTLAPHNEHRLHGDATASRSALCTANLNGGFQK